MGGRFKHCGLRACIGNRHRDVKTSCRAKSICISVIRVTNLGDKLNYVFLLEFIDWSGKTSLSRSFRQISLKYVYKEYYILFYIYILLYLK